MKTDAKSQEDTPLVREALEAAAAGDERRFSEAWFRASEGERWTLRAHARVRTIALSMARGAEATKP